MSGRMRIVYRLALSMLAGILLAGIGSELTYRLLRRSEDRAPEVILLTIPAGTAERVAGGETPPSIPDAMVFVVGDRLRIRNEDVVAHQLGVVWIPAGQTAEFFLDEVEEFAFACTFRSDKYLGMSVREPLTLSTRIMGILSAGTPLGLLIGLYLVFAAGGSRKQEAPPA